MFLLERFQISGTCRDNLYMYSQCQGMQASIFPVRVDVHNAAGLFQSQRKGVLFFSCQSCTKGCCTAAAAALPYERGVFDAYQRFQCHFCCVKEQDAKGFFDNLIFPCCYSLFCLFPCLFAPKSLGNNDVGDARQIDRLQFIGKAVQYIGFCGNLCRQRHGKLSQIAVSFFFHMTVNEAVCAGYF